MDYEIRVGFLFFMSLVFALVFLQITLSFILNLEGFEKIKGWVVTILFAVFIVELLQIIASHSTFLFHDLTSMWFYENRYVELIAMNGIVFAHIIFKRFFTKWYEDEVIL